MRSRDSARSASKGTAQLSTTPGSRSEGAERASLARSPLSYRSGMEGLPSSERVYRGLKEQILNGAVSPNARLVELQLAEQFKVSRTPVREALKRLVAEGLVWLDPLRGLVARDLDPVEIEEIYTIREVLDGLAARLAAQRISTEDMSKLQLLMEMMRESMRARQWEAMVQANVKFHEIINNATGNRRLVSLSRSLQDFVRRFSNVAFASPERDEEVLAEHEEIFRAFEARDPALAEAAARRHIAEARANLAELYLTQPDPSSVP